MFAGSVRWAVVLGLALSPPVALPFEPTGEVRLQIPAQGIAGATFDDNAVVGPNANLTRREDGSWAGDLDGRDLDLHLKDGKIKGASVTLAVSATPEKSEVNGTAFGVRLRATFTAKTVTIRYGECAIDMKRKGPGLFAGEVGCLRRGTAFPTHAQGTLRLMGKAGEMPAPIPQLALALIAVLPH